MSKEFNIKIRNVTFLHSYMLYINYMWYHFNGFGSPLLYDKDLKSNDKDNISFETFIVTDLGQDNLQKVKEILSLIYSYELIAIESLYKLYNIKEQTSLFDAVNEIIIAEASFNNLNQSKEYFKVINVPLITDTENYFTFDLGQVLSDRTKLNTSYIQGPLEPNFYFQKVANVTWKNLNDLPESLKTVNKKGFSVLQSISFDSNLNGIVDPNFLTTNLLNKLDQYKQSENFLNNLDNFIDLQLGVRVVLILKHYGDIQYNFKDKLLKQNILVSESNRFLVLPISNCSLLTKESAELLKQTDIIDYKSYVKALTQQEQYEKFVNSVNINYYNNSILIENMRTLNKIYDILGEEYANISYSYGLTKNMRDIIINKTEEFL